MAYSDKARSIAYADFWLGATSTNSDENYTMEIQMKEVTLRLSTVVCENIEWRIQQTA
jgi:hypothetical protein